MNHQEELEKAKRIRTQRKIDVLTHYGNGKLACVRCGFNDIRALSLDHIDGGGNEHRRGSKITGSGQIYKWVIDNKFPDGYQTLCMNCQFIKRVENNETHWRDIAKRSNNARKAKMLKEAPLLKAEPKYFDRYIYKLWKPRFNIDTLKEAFSIKNSDKEYQVLCTYLSRKVSKGELIRIGHGEYEVVLKYD